MFVPGLFLIRTDGLSQAQWQKKKEHDYNMSFFKSTTGHSKCGKSYYKGICCGLVRAAVRLTIKHQEDASQCSGVVVEVF